VLLRDAITACCAIELDSRKRITDVEPRDIGRCMPGSASKGSDC
jgi:hypothetical protein